MKTKIKAFTLAEMMVVLLILSLILAAFLPILTTRLNSSNSSTSAIWKWADDKTNIYFGKENTPGAAIGTNAITSSDNTRFLLNTSSAVSNQKHILFKEDDNSVGNLKVKTDGSIIFTGYNGYTSENSEGILIGEGTLPQRSIKIGHDNGASVNMDSDSVAVGYNTRANGTYTVSIGKEAKTSQFGAVALGSGANAGGWDSVALGYGALAPGNYTSALGGSACDGVKGAYKTCVGYGSGPTATSQFANEIDSAERLFFGRRPLQSGNYGDAVLEIHNTNSGATVNTLNMPDNAPTVVINGHLVVRGYTYIRTGAGEGLRRITGDSSELQGNYATPPGWSWPVMSDRRLKNVSGFNTDGLDKIRELKTYNYTFKKDKHKYKHVGVMAQDLQKVFPNAVRKTKNGFFQVRTDDIFFAMVNAIKELAVKIDSIILRLNSTDEKIKELQIENKQLQEQNRLMEIRLSKLESGIRR